MSQSGQPRGRGGRPYNRGSRGGCGNWRGSRRGWRGQQQGYGRGRGRGNISRGTGKPSGGGTGSQPSSSQARTIQSYLLEPQTPYKGWTLYLPDETYSANSSLVAQVKLMEKYFAQSKHLFNLTEIENNGYFCVDFKEMISDQSVSEGLPNLAADIKMMPERIVNCLGLAMHQVITKELQREEMLDASQTLTGSGSQIPAQVSVSKIHCRITNYDAFTQLKNLKANCYGNFVSVKGTVVRVSNIKPMCTKMAFCCASCGIEQVAALPEGKYIFPTKCAGDSCQGRTFSPLRNHPMTETIDWQTIRVQEIMDDDQRESGRIPRTVDCELTHDLVDKCVPGDMVAVTGIVKVMSADDGNRGRDKDKCMFLLYIHANSVMNAKGGRGSSGEQSSGQAMEFTIKELYAIEEIHSEDNLLRLIVGSLCPSIYGHEMVKAGLVLGLFGGTHKYVNDKNRVPVRGDPHILVVGDPGLGKSQMLHACANVAPRSVYVCGNTTTTSGLTVTLVKEGGGGGDYALEAGALVLADQGCCCIDEFDKMGNQHQALLEAMEQQSISIAKAGIVCSLPARTSILAAANPVGGHYNKAKTVSENLKMGGALLSRFDLAFILLDKPDEEMDSMLSEHVMALHAGRKRSVAGTPRISQTQEEKMAKMAWDADKPLSERLKVSRGESLDPIPAQLLRKYICYARKYVHPKICPAAAQVIQKFYLDLRKMHQTQDCTPITTRQLESLIRLTEARARLELREEVLEQDALDVVEIMKYSMIDTYSDQFGFLDFKRSQHGSGMSSRSQGKKFISLLQRISEQTYNSLFTVQELNKIAREANIRIADFENFISSLNNQGYLLKKGSNVYQLQTAGF